MNLLLYFLVAAFVVFADLFTKFLVKASETLMSGDVIDIIPGVFRFRYVENPGAAMGSFAGNRWVFMVFSTVAIVVIAVYLIKAHKTVNRMFGVALAMIAGGGIGNMYERLFNQNAQGIYVVTDFVDFHLFSFWKWVFNGADVAVCVGAGLVVLYLLIDLVREYRYQKNPAAYDELVAVDTIEVDEEDRADLMALDGAQTEPESPLDFGESEELCEEGSEDLEALDGAYDEEDAFPIYDPEDADGDDEEHDFFVEEKDDDDLF